MPRAGWARVASGEKLYIYMYETSGICAYMCCILLLSFSFCRCIYNSKTVLIHVLYIYILVMFVCFTPAYSASKVHTVGVEEFNYTYRTWTLCFKWQRKKLQTRLPVTA